MACWKEKQLLPLQKMLGIWLNIEHFVREHFENWGEPNMTADQLRS